MRFEQLQTWLSLRHFPEIVCLQETKVVDELFPANELKTLGYESAFFGQKSYNGVCILSKFPMSDVVRGIGKPEIDKEARIISVTIQNIRVINVYVPNGQAPGTEKFAWKFELLNALIAFVAQQKKLYPKLIVCGDINIAYTDQDIWNADRYKEMIMATARERELFTKLLKVGLVDVYRNKYPDKFEFTWFDYMTNAFEGNRGWRIDYILGTPDVVTLVEDIAIDQIPRAYEKPSDHCPMVVLLKD